MQRGIAQIYLLIVLLIAGALGGYYYFSKTSTKPVIPQPTSSVTPTKTADETANWKTIVSSRCGFSINYPLTWRAKETELISGNDNSKYHYGCINIDAPDFKITQPDKREGLEIQITRTTKGSSSIGATSTTVINSLDDYINAIEGVTNPVQKVANLKDATYMMNGSSIKGKYYEFSAFETLSYFIFTNGNYIYEISWPKAFNPIYNNQLNQILSTFKFTN